MITSPKEKDFPAAKQEGPAGDGKLYKAPSASSRQWSSPGLRNPRIVRVSRTFGGKDRHSKVCTVRGLRDRRIRLSVPTAVQLYDLQDRLGLSQPSKVIDWLIDAAKLDIDKLPPLQIPQGALGQFLHHHNNHDHHHHQHLNLLDPRLDDQVKTNEQDQFAQKLFVAPSSYVNHYQNYTDQTPFFGRGIALPGQYFDGISGHNNLFMSTANPSTTTSFNSGSIQPVSQLFFCAPPPSNSTTTSFLSSTPYPSYMSSSTTQYHENPHETIRAQMINNHIQLMSSNSSIISSTSASSSSSSSSTSSASQQFHILNNPLMSSLHTASANNNNNYQPLIKSFPAILNPRLLAPSSAYENRPEKDRSTTAD